MRNQDRLTRKIVGLESSRFGEGALPRSIHGRCLWWVLAFVVLLCCGRMPAQTPASPTSPTPTGAVIGQVTYADTQLPARLAHVVLQPMVDLHSPALGANGKERTPEGVFHLQTVGLDGSFAITAVPQGLYYVIAEQDGYISPLSLFTRADLNRPDDAMLRKIARYMTPISVTAGQTTQVQVRLIRGATIGGTVRFEDGSPVVNSAVNLLQRDAKGEWKSIRTGHLASHNSSYTDEQGAYRFSGLPAGEYLVRASVELNNVMLNYIFASGGSTNYGDGYRLRIFPGDVFRPRDAKPVKVEEGESVPGEDIDVPLSKLHSLSGVVLRPNSAAAVNAAHLTLVYPDTGDEVVSTEVNTNDGSFHFDFVPEGNYTLRVTGIADVQRTEVPSCEQCVPPTRTETKILTSYGNVSMPVQLTGDQSGLIVHAKPAANSSATGQ